MALYDHKSHIHVPRNVNELHKASFTSINDKIAVVLTNGVSTMWCAYGFAIIAIIGFPGFRATPTQWVQWVSQTLIQLVMLSVIMVGQKVNGRHQERQAEESYQATLKSFHDIEQIMQHLSAQDDELLKQTTMLMSLIERQAHDGS